MKVVPAENIKIGAVNPRLENQRRKIGLFRSRNWDPSKISIVCPCTIFNTAKALKRSRKTTLFCEALVVISNYETFVFASTIISISTEASRGSTFTPTAARACFPFSPNIFKRSSEAPLATSG